MKIIVNCEAPAELKGNYTFEYMSSVFDFFCQIEGLKANLRDGYIGLLKEHGFLEVRTKPYAFRITVAKDLAEVLDAEKT